MLVVTRDADSWKIWPAEGRVKRTEVGYVGRIY